jgi:hypothetical protein
MMKPALILGPAALLILSGCASGGAGVPRLPPPDAALTAPCAHPSAHLGAETLEIMAGRIGDDLIDCGARHAALATWAAAISGSTRP